MGLAGMNTSGAIVQKLWNHCNVLRDSGMSYGDYVEQLAGLCYGGEPPDQTLRHRVFKDHLSS